MKKNIALKNIVDMRRWQKIQDHFAEVMGVPMRTVEKGGKPITRLSNPAGICREVLSTSAGAKFCSGCLPPSFDDLLENDKWRDGYSCHFGLYSFCIPVIAFDHQAAAYILVGPLFLGQRRELQEYGKEIEALGIEPDRLIGCLSEIKLLSHNSVQSVIELISGITGYITQLGYDRYKLVNIIPLPKIGKIVHRNYLNRILNALLEVSLNTVKAESGSIMLLDEKSGELYIKISKGLKDEIVKNTRLRIGEGIAGLAVKENRLLLLDDTLKEAGVKSRLKRPEIKSAMVAPFNMKDEPLGVMNLATTKPSNRIGRETLEIIQRLVELTESSLTDLL